MTVLTESYERLILWGSQDYGRAFVALLSPVVESDHFMDMSFEKCKSSEEGKRKGQRVCPGQSKANAVRTTLSSS